MFQTKDVHKIETHLMFSNSFFLKIVLLRDNVEKYVHPSGPQTTIWRMRIAYWTPKATNTHSQNV
jgi:hypothetical protein